jgi:hypothetical protein
MKRGGGAAYLRIAAGGYVNLTRRHVALQQMLEYQDFLLAFKGLGERGGWGE